jgi:sulfoxide reductase heme-binding subunit YedZ
MAVAPAEAMPRPSAGRGPAPVNWVPWAKAVLWVAALYPAGRLAWTVLNAPEDLGANPAETILHVTGDWTLQFLLLTLAVTPLRKLSGWNWPIKFRRLLGLFAFFYGVLHLSAYIGFDRYFRFDEIGADIVKRPFITVGMLALALMLPLAVTSTRGWIRRLGAQRWNRLHKLVYPVALLGVLHYWWLVKRDVTWPLIYAGILALLLGIRALWALRPRQPRRLRAA